MIHVANQEVRSVPLDELDFMKRYACRYCSDYAAEFADLSFGGLGAPEGWTTVISRTPLGKALFGDAVGVAIEEFPNKAVATQTMAKVLEWSEWKKQRAGDRHQDLAQSQCR